MTTENRFEELEVWQKARFLGRAKGSAGELRAQLYIALEQNYMTREEFESISALAEICSKQLARLIQYLESQPNTRRVREGEIIYDLPH